MGDAGELAYIANLLNGDPSQAPQNPAGAPRGRGRGRGRRGGHSGRGRGGSAAPNAGAGPSTAPAPTPADTDTDPLNRPRESSSPKLWHCEACDVLVPRRPGDWEVHVAGIRHRRQVLSLREHGQRGRLVMSVFESAPQPDGGQGSQHRLAGNAASEAAGDDDFRRLMSMGKSVDREIIAPARTAALAQMLGIYGRSWLYDAVSDTEFNLTLLSGLGFVMYHSLYAADNQQKMKRLNESSPSPAFLAFVATALRQGALPGPLPPLIVLKMQGGGFVGSVSTAAWLCSLIMLLEALAARPSRVTVLWIAVRTDPLGGQMDGNVMRDGWARVLIVLRHLLASLVSGLEEVKLFLGGAGPVEAGADIVHVGIGDALVNDTMEALSGLQAAAADAAKARRLAVAMATHPRLGRCSALQLLPTPVLEQIALTAAPRGGCRVVIERRDLPEPGPEWDERLLNP